MLAKALGAVVALCLLSLFGACHKAPETKSPEVAAVGSAVLTAADLAAAMPAGLSSDDSARFVKAYVNSWIDAKLVTEVAASRIDMTDIDRLTDEYRSQLIMQEYTRRMFEAHASEIPDDSIRTYYDAHSADFVLDRPMVRGVYVKVPDDARNLRTIRRLIRSDRSDDIDRLEKEVISSAAIHYDYFRDRWVDWEQIESRVPQDFGANPADWLRRSGRDARMVDLTTGGFTYLLRITDVLLPGSPMPLESATPQIRRRLLASNRRAYQARLLRELRDSASTTSTLRTTVE